MYLYFSLIDKKNAQSDFKKWHAAYRKFLLTEQSATWLVSLKREKSPILEKVMNEQFWTEKNPLNLHKSINNFCSNDVSIIHYIPFV